MSAIWVAEHPTWLVKYRKALALKDRLKPLWLRLIVDQKDVTRQNGIFLAHDTAATDQPAFIDEALGLAHVKAILQ